MPNSNILMYTTEDGLTKIEATFENDTVRQNWYVTRNLGRKLSK